MSYRSNPNLPCGERRCLPLRPKNLRISSPSLDDNLYHQLNRLAQLGYSTGPIPIPPLRHACEFMGPEKSPEEMRKEIKVFQEDAKVHIGGSALGGVKMEKDLEMFHQSLDLITPKPPKPHVTSGREVSEERKIMGPETFLERRAAKMKVDREVNMRLHGNRSSVYPGIGSAEESQHTDERLRADESRGVASIACANIDAYGVLEEANMPQMESFEVTRPPWSRDTPCNHRKPCNNVWPGCMNSEFFGFGDFAPELAVEDRRKQVDMAKGNAKSGDLIKGAKETVGELAGSDREVDMSRIIGGETGEGEAKKDRLNEKSRTKNEDEWEGDDTEEMEKERTVEDTREDYIHVVQSNFSAECDGNRKTKEQLALFDHLSRPHNPKSKWILVNEFAEDGEEFVFVEKE